MAVLGSVLPALLAGLVDALESAVAAAGAESSAAVDAIVRVVQQLTIDSPLQLRSYLKQASTHTRSRARTYTHT
jgi:hypothetical protein